MHNEIIAVSSRVVYDCVKFTWNLFATILCFHTILFLISIERILLCEYGDLLHFSFTELLEEHILFQFFKTVKFCKQRFFSTPLQVFYLDE